MTTTTEITTSPTHYIFGGEKYARVSEVLRRAGLVDTRFYNEDAADKGTGVHKTIELFLDGTLGKEAPEVTPYLDAFRLFLAEADGEVLCWERIVIHEELKIAGTFDLQVKFPSGENCILDFKTGQAEDWHRLQLQGYLLLNNSVESDHKADTGRCLYLDKKGGYKLSPVLCNAWDTRDFETLAKNFGG